MQNTIQFIIGEDGNIWKEQNSYINLGNQSAILESALGASPRNLGPTFSCDGVQVGVQLKGKSTYLYGLVPEIKLNTWFRLRSGKIVMSYNQTDAEDFQASFKWKPPEGMLVWLVEQFVDKTHNMAWLVATDQVERRHYKPPLPNLFADAQVCLGGYNPGSLTDWQSRFSSLYKHFQDSPWNTDLVSEAGGSEKTDAMFSFSEAGQPLPVTDWKTHCKLVNTTHYGELPIPL